MGLPVWKCRQELRPAVPSTPIRGQRFFHRGASIGAWNGVATLRIPYSRSGVTATADGDAIVLTATHESSHAAARELADAVENSPTARREFLHTTGHHRADGRYVVARRGADSAGNRKVFDSVEALRRRYARLPYRFDAEAVGRTGINGSRRHMIVRHFAEHAAFHCRTVSRNPLVVEKRECQVHSGGEASLAGD
jgi:hypothetical protein